MNDIEVMLPLYPPAGSPVSGYLCCAKEAGRTCRRVTKTKRGMWNHLFRVHGIKKQTSFEFQAPSQDKAVVEYSA